MSVAFERGVSYFDHFGYDVPMVYEESGPHFVDPPEWHEEPGELGDPGQDAVNDEES